MAAASGSQSRILIALVLGALLGCLANYAVESTGSPEAKLERKEFAGKTHEYIHPWPAKDAVAFLTKFITGPIGTIFISLLFLSIIPLVFASLALGVTRLGGESNVGRIGFKTITYFILTTAAAGVIGLTLVNLIKPGQMLQEESAALIAHMPSTKAAAPLNTGDFLVNTFVSIVPRNPLKSFSEKEMLAVIFTALFVGIALTRIDPAKAKPIVDFLEGVNAITDFIIRTAMAFAPIGVFCLIFTTTALFGIGLLQALAWFMATVLSGLAIQLLVVFPILVLVLGKMNPLDFFQRSKAAMLTAFSTSSSSATLPVAMKTAEENLGVPPRISRFVLPLSASMNHNGTALFEAVTAVFICQLFGVHLSFEQQLIVLLLCVVTATGMAGVPGGSLPLIGLVIHAVAPSIPAEAIGIVLGVDRILDMTRTMVNVTGDLTTAIYVARSDTDPSPPEASGGLSPPTP